MNAKAIGFTAVGIIVLVGLFVWFRPAGPEAPAGPAPVAAPAKPVKPPPVEVAVNLELKGGKRIKGPERILARQGEVLRLRVTSDAKDELHVHGYDFKADVGPASPTELRFPLTTAGRFAVELHHSHSVITVLEVQPKS